MKKVHKRLPPETAPLEQPTQSAQQPDQTEPSTPPKGSHLPRKRLIGTGPGQKPPPFWWHTFTTEWMRNGQNVRAAYLMARSGAKCSRETASAEGARLLRNPRFKIFLDGMMKEAGACVGMTRNRWLSLLKDCAEFDLRSYLRLESGSGDVQLSPDWQERHDGHALQSVELATTTQESGAVVQRVKLKAAGKLEALKTLGMALGYLQNVNINLNVDMNDLNRQLQESARLLHGKPKAPQEGEESHSSLSEKT